MKAILDYDKFLAFRQDPYVFQSIKAVARSINSWTDNCDSDTPLHIVEQSEMAAQHHALEYAYNASLESSLDEPVCVDEISAHLDCLKDAGARFCFASVLELAEQLLQISEIKEEISAQCQ